MSLCDCHIINIPRAFLVEANLYGMATRLLRVSSPWSPFSHFPDGSQSNPSRTCCRNMYQSTGRRCTVNPFPIVPGSLLHFLCKKGPNTIISPGLLIAGEALRIANYLMEMQFYGKWIIRRNRRASNRAPVGPSAWREPGHLQDVRQSRTGRHL